MTLYARKKRLRRASFFFIIIFIWEGLIKGVRKTELELLYLESVLIGDAGRTVNICIRFTAGSKLVLVGVGDALHDEYSVRHIDLIVTVCIAGSAVIGGRCYG